MTVPLRPASGSTTVTCATNVPGAAFSGTAAPTARRGVLRHRGAVGADRRQSVDDDRRSIVVDVGHSDDDGRVDRMRVGSGVFGGHYQLERAVRLAVYRRPHVYLTC